MLNIQPQNVFHWFYELNQIPRESGHEEAVSNFLANFAKARKLEVFQDTDSWNIIIKKPASPGYEAAAPLILQGHMDMVCVKTEGSNHDFRKDPIEMVVDGDYLKAKETTLGADDGIAVAMMLALLDGNYAHPALECLMTTNEETTMGGAEAVKPGQLVGKRLINIDSEEEGIFLTSCAGGETDKISFAIEKTNVAGSSLKIEVSGLKGGHSGQEIIRQRANANIVLFRVLNAIARVTELHIAGLAGGIKDNAIPDRAWAQVVVADSEKAETALANIRQAIQAEYATEDSGLDIQVSKVKLDEVYSAALTRQLLDFFAMVPDGLQFMSPDVAGLVQTSLNNAVLYVEDSQVILQTSLRSSSSSQLEALADKLARIAKACGANFERLNSYPAWQFEPDSPLRELCLSVWEDTFGQPAAYDAIHAGLECGMLKSALPDCDMISYGPNLFDVHSPKERLDIISSARIWEFTVNLLARMKD